MFSSSNRRRRTERFPRTVSPAKSNAAAVASGARAECWLILKKAADCRYLLPPRLTSIAKLREDEGVYAANGEISLICSLPAVAWRCSPRNAVAD